MKSCFGHFVKAVWCLAYNTSFSILIFLFTSSWAGVGAYEGIDASDGVLSVEDWLSFEVTLSVISRPVSVDSLLDVGGSLIVTLVLFFLL